MTYTVKDFKNASNNTFVSLESEQRRTYTYPGGNEVTIEEPLLINTKPSGHRIFDASGTSHYIPKGWIHLSWVVKEGKPHFDF